MKKIIITIVVLLVILAGGFSLVQYMDYSIKEDLQLKDLSVGEVLFNDESVEIDDNDEKIIVDAISQATFKREFSKPAMVEEYYEITINNSQGDTLVFQFDGEGNGSVMSKSKENTKTLLVKPELLEELKEVLEN